uniref:CChamide-like 1 n=1 Tax=Ophionotus victoriae TaxID=667017 RepID=A0A220W0D3_9ECHI|nr:CChamide-like 1 precursor [Ophionotus victoriae]
MFSIYSFSGLARLLLLICLLIALTHPVYSTNHCKGRLPKFCFLHPGKRNSQQTTAVTDDREGQIQLDNMQLSNSDSSVRTMKAILALLLGPVNQEERYPEVEDDDSLSRSQKVTILTRLLESRSNSY